MSKTGQIECLSLMENIKMIDLLIGLAFVALIVTPAIAATVQRSHEDPEKKV
jgi:hypothetical protein